MSSPELEELIDKNLEFKNELLNAKKLTKEKEEENALRNLELIKNLKLK